MKRSFKSYLYNDIEDIINNHDLTFKGNLKNVKFNNVDIIGLGDEESLVWTTRTYLEEKNIKNIQENLIIIDEIPEFIEKGNNSSFLICKNPRLTFSRIVGKLFTEKKKTGIHGTSVIHPNAQIHDSCYIGPNCTIGDAVIGKNTVINGNVYIHDNVQIGADCLIDAGSVIGADGFGHIKDENNEWFKFPHVGGTIIEDNVEIGALTYITKGAISNTHIKRGVKIALSVCIGHNVVVGERSIVLSNSIIGGSTVLGADCWVSISASLKDNLIVGEKSTIGMGAIVLKNVEAGTTIVGNPGRKLK